MAGIVFEKIALLRTHFLIRIQHYQDRRTKTEGSVCGAHSKVKVSVDAVLTFGCLKGRERDGGITAFVLLPICGAQRFVANGDRECASNAEIVPNRHVWFEATEEDQEEPHRLKEPVIERRPHCLPTKKVAKP